MAKSILSKINYNMKSLISTFGGDSEIVQAARDYLESRLDDKYLKRDKATNEIIGVVQSKDLTSKQLGRDKTVLSYIPSAKQLIKQEVDTYKEELKQKNKNDLTDEEKQILKSSSAKIMKDPKLETFFTNQAKKTAADLSDYDTITDEVYEVADNKEDLIEDAQYYMSWATGLLNDRNTMTMREWVIEARQLVTKYIEAVETERRNAES